MQLFLKYYLKFQIQYYKNLILIPDSVIAKNCSCVPRDSHFTKHYSFVLTDLDESVDILATNDQ